MKKAQPERLLSQKLRLAWIIAPKRSSVFKSELDQLEEVLKILPREKAHDLAIYTASYFKLPNVKTVLPPATSQTTAAEILCDELKNFLDGYRSITIFKKLVLF